MVKKKKETNKFRERHGHILTVKGGGGGSDSHAIGTGPGKKNVDGGRRDAGLT